MNKIFKHKTSYLIIDAELVIYLFLLFIEIIAWVVNDYIIDNNITTKQMMAKDQTEHSENFIPKHPTIVYKTGEDNGLEQTYYIIHKESLGYYFITAYCPWECGYNGENYPAGWMTASGTECHRADWENRLIEPTTCAISRSCHSFGDMFYIEEFDRVFVAEDTGPGVNGKHLDLFYEDYDDVIGFPTGYYEVFSVWYEEVSYYPGEFLEVMDDVSN